MEGDPGESSRGGGVIEVSSEVGRGKVAQYEKKRHLQGTRAATFLTGKREAPTFTSMYQDFDLAMHIP